MEALLDLLGYGLLLLIGLSIAVIPIVIAVIIRAGMKIKTRVICPKCNEKIRPQKTGGQRVVGIKGESVEESQCPLCDHTWWG